MEPGLCFALPVNRNQRSVVEGRLDGFRVAGL